MSVKSSEINLDTVSNYVTGATGVAFFSLLITQVIVDFRFHNIALSDEKTPTSPGSMLRLLVLFFVILFITQTTFMISTKLKCDKPSLNQLQGPFWGMIGLGIYALLMQTLLRGVGFFQKHGWMIFTLGVLVYLGFYSIYPIFVKPNIMSWWNLLPPTVCVLLYLIYSQTLEPWLLSTFPMRWTFKHLGFVGKALYVTFLGSLFYITFFPFVYGSSFVENEEKVCLME